MEMNAENFRRVTERLESVIQDNARLTNNITQIVQQITEIKQENVVLQNELMKTKVQLEAVHHSSDGKQHVQRANLLKSKEPTSFTNKTNYSVWAEGIKADLVPVLPELKHF